MSRTLVACGLAAALLVPAHARAHVTFEAQEAPQGATYKAVLRVPHGCDGQATRSIRIAIPDGVVAVKPMPKAGWQLATTKGRYARAYDDHGTPMTEGVKEIAWSDGNLPDDWYDEFVFQALVTDLPEDTVLAFPTVQGCAHGEVRWDQVAAVGQNSHDLARPAPTVTVVAQSPEMAGHGGHGDMARFTVGDLVVERPWARESVTGTGAVYLTVRNGGDQDDRLVGVSSDVADKAELHESTMQDGVMKMRPIETLDVPAQGEAVLEPGGLHVMLMGLKEPLEQGQSFPLTLEFERAGPIQVTTVIEDVGYGGGGRHEHDHSN